jgi:hypothetical protein
MAMFAFNGRGVMAALVMMAMVGDDDIISMGGSNAEIAIIG